MLLLKSLFNYTYLGHFSIRALGDALAEALEPVVHLKFELLFVK